MQLVTLLNCSIVPLYIQHAAAATPRRHPITFCCADTDLSRVSRPDRLLGCGRSCARSRSREPDDPNWMGSTAAEPSSPRTGGRASRPAEELLRRMLPGGRSDRRVGVLGSTCRAAQAAMSLIRGVH